MAEKIKKTQDKKPPSRLYRSETDRVIAGVCGGLGEFFQIDSTIIRLIFALITLFGGGGFLLYIVLWLIVPPQGSKSELSKDNISKNADEMKESAKKFADEIKINTTRANSKQLLGIIVLVFGILLLLGNFGFLNLVHLWKYLPAAAIIVLGIMILKRGE